MVACSQVATGARKVATENRGSPGYVATFAVIQKTYQGAPNGMMKVRQWL